MTSSFPRHAQDTPLPPKYWDAVEDTKTPEPQEVFRNLTPITRHNTRLIWDKDDRVLVSVKGYLPPLHFAVNNPSTSYCQNERS